MIRFENVPWEDFDPKGLANWLKLVAAQYQSVVETLNYSFLNDEEIKEANGRHLDHHYSTDILTFGYKEGTVVSGDVLLGYETIAENAKLFKVSIHEEMCRVMAHGLLHMIGFDDQTPEQKRDMRQAEEKALILRPKNLIL